VITAPSDRSPSAGVTGSSIPDALGVPEEQFRNRLSEYVAAVQEQDKG
jgi:hypothetical protein